LDVARLVGIVAELLSEPTHNMWVVSDVTLSDIGEALYQARRKQE
jgi:hypothetical protein